MAFDGLAGRAESRYLYGLVDVQTSDDEDLTVHGDTSYLKKLRVTAVLRSL